MSDDWSGDDGGDFAGGGDFGGSSAGDSFGDRSESSSYSEVSSSSWFSRLLNSFKQMIFGLVLFVVAFPLLFWNEGRAVHRAQDLAEGTSTAQIVTSDSVDPQWEGQLIYTSGKATSEGTLTDELFQISVEHALKLHRTVEMYQWKERKEEKTERQTGGSERTVTTYHYDKNWYDESIHSESFRHPEGHENPSHKPVENQSLEASIVTVGAFTLPQELVGRINAYETRPILDDDLTKLPSEVQEKYHVQDGRFYFGKSPEHPAIGDARISISMVKPTVVSLVAKQQQSSFAPYQTHGGRLLYELKTGDYSKDQFFQQLNQENVMLLWILRLAGWIVMFLGLAMIMNPIKILADVIPFIGSIAQVGIGLVAGLISLALSLVTIAVGWFFYRPVFATVLIVVAIALFGLIGYLIKKSRPRVAH